MWKETGGLLCDFTGILLIYDKKNIRNSIDICPSF